MSKKPRMILFYEEFKAQVSDLIMRGVDLENIIYRFTEGNTYSVSPKIAEDEEKLKKEITNAVHSFKSYKLIRAVIEKELIIPNNKKKWYIFDKLKGESRSVPPDQVKSLFRDSAIYLGNANHCKVVYDPHKYVFFYEERSEECFNCYTPPFWKKNLVLKGEVIASAPMPPIYLDFLRHLTGNHEPSVQYTLDWMANSLHRRNPTYLCTIGNEGIGKGVLGQILKALHGDENYVELAFHEATQQFNAALEGKSLVYLDEANQTDGTKQAQVIKRFNAENLMLEPKGIDRHSVPNHLNVYMSSNHLSSLHISPEARRFSIINLGDVKLNAVWSQERINALFDKDTLKQFAQYLWSREIQWHNMDSFFADARSKQVIEASTKDWEKWIIDEFCKDHAGKVIRVTDVIKESANALTAKVNLTTNSIRELANRFPGIYTLEKTDKYDYLFPHDDAGKQKNRVYCVSILDKAKQKSYDLIETDN